MNTVFKVANRVEEYNTLAKELKIPKLMAPVSEATIVVTKEQANRILNDTLLKKIDRLIRKRNGKKISAISTFLDSIGLSFGVSTTKLEKLMHAERILASIILECKSAEIERMSVFVDKLGRRYDV